jgi:hypothetical protein
MKAQLILLLLLASVVTTKAYAVEAESDTKQETKKTTKSKYDFNIFKLYSLVYQQDKPDSLNLQIKALPLKMKENI